MKLVRRLATATALATLALVAAGAIVRATGSGLGCPDWPRCNGRLLPPLEFHAIVEWSHRFVASIVVVLIIATAWAAWRRARGERAIVRPAVLAIGVVFLQAALGAVVVAQELDPVPNTIHFGTAMLLVATVVVTATNAWFRRPASEALATARMRRLLRVALGLTALTLLAGVYMRGSGASLAFLDWPLMGGRVIPELASEPAWAAFLHRLVAGATLLALAAVAIRARELHHRGLRALAYAAFGLALAQSGLGAATVLTRLSTPAVAGHVLGSGLTWAALVVLVTATRRAAAEEEAPRQRAREVAGAYAQLMKPDIIVLLLVTTVPAMILAHGGMPSIRLVAATLLGGTLAAGGANALNHYLDRDIDEVMDRTRERPIPAHAIAPAQAARFGIAMAATAFVWLTATVNLPAALLALSAVLFYVLVYTMWMKRSTPQNIVIGGAAGAVPALVGWAAVTGTVGLPAWALFSIIFFWTPAHFWALSLKYAGDYAAAGVPMLVVVRGSRETGLQIVLYAVQTVAVSLMLAPLADMGAVYLASAAALGAAFVWYAVQVAREGTTRAAMHLFHFSITYLGLLFAAVAVDVLVRAA